jgi:hypothetical protein
MLPVTAMRGQDDSDNSETRICGKANSWCAAAFCIVSVAALRAASSFDGSEWVLDTGPFQVDMANDLLPKATEGSMENVHVGVPRFPGARVQA